MILATCGLAVWASAARSSLDADSAMPAAARHSIPSLGALASGWAVDFDSYIGYTFSTLLPDGAQGWIGVGASCCRVFATADGWIAKLDDRGQFTAQKEFSGPPHNDWLNDIAPTADGGWVVCGSTYSYDAGRYNGDGWVARLAKDLRVVWQKVYRSTDASFRDEAHSIVQAGDGGFVFLTNHDSYTRPTLTKLDSSGTPKWRKTYLVNVSWPYDGAFARPVPTSDGGWILAGYDNLTGSDVVLMRVDVDGDLVWAKTLDAKLPYEGTDIAYDAIRTSDGDLVLAGATDSYGMHYEGWIVKFDEDGDLVWQYRYQAAEDYQLGAVRELPDGALILTGSDGALDLHAMRISAAGKKLWSTRYRAKSDKWWDNMPTGLAPDGGFLVANSADKLFRFDKNGGLTASCKAAKYGITTKKTDAVLADIEVTVQSSKPKKVNFKATLKDTDRETVSICG